MVDEDEGKDAHGADEESVVNHQAMDRDEDEHDDVEASGSAGDEDHDDDDDEDHGLVSEGEEDPLAPDFLLDDVDHGEAQRRPAISNRVKTPKEFFATEILYRHDILEDEARQAIAGTYRFEIRGADGGVWTLEVGEDISIQNMKADADTVLSMDEDDFVRLVNGDINPQIALLAHRIRVHGSIDKAVAVQYLLSPTGE
ncbi:MAG: SCP2 sterol-binding domain-containing protein [Bdellovibrionales bacterium]|nr:SCP2 sterol-binding domain-containing protein [Bdellovibrionales bacterium]